MRIDLMTLFPEMCDRVMSESIVGRARARGDIEVCCHQIRDYTLNRQCQVDDYPYGGGLGMVLFPQPIADCFRAVCEQTGTRPHLIYMTPQGKTLTQKRAVELSKMDNLCILCGHYEGVDERIIEEVVDMELSIGDFVLTGGELPACIVADAVGRLCEGVLSDPECHEKESFSEGLLEYPQYTRPYDYHGMKVPDVLISGHHENIDKWRREKSLEITAARRPDLLKKD